MGSGTWRHLFDIPIIYIDHNAIDFDGSHTQGPDTATVPRSYFHNSCDGQNLETCLTFDPSVVPPSNHKSHFQSQDVQTATDLRQNDSSEQTSESNTDNETAYEPMQHPPLRQIDPPSTIDITNPTTKKNPQNQLGHSRGGEYDLRPNPTPNYPEIYRHQCVQKSTLVLSLCQFSSLLSVSSFIFPLFSHTYPFPFFCFGRGRSHQHQQNLQKCNIQN